MAGKRYIPERTVDSLLAAELVRYDPYALIWSPSQLDPLPVDHYAVGRSGRTIVFECKAVSSSKPSDDDGGVDWWAEIDTAQLAGYVGLNFPVVYLFVPRPNDYDLDRPWMRRPCGVSPCDGQMCLRCARDARSWGGLEPAVTSVGIRCRLQPWFAHWGWVITATNLQRWILAQYASVPLRANLKVKDASLADLRDNYSAVRLCHLLNVDGGPGGGSSGPVPPDPTDGMVIGPDRQDIDLGVLTDGSIPQLADEDSTPPVVAIM